MYIYRASAGHLREGHKSQKHLPHFVAPILDRILYELHPRALDLVTTSAFVRALPLHNAHHLEANTKVGQIGRTLACTFRQAGSADGQLNLNGGSCGSSPTRE